MARGTVSASLREERTNTLLAELADIGDSSRRDDIVDELVQLNLGLCDALANRYLNRGADRDDLVQVARLALLMAIRRFRPGEGRSFVAFAAPTITGELKRHFRDHCWVVRPPRRIQELRSQAGRSRQQLEQSLGRAATTSELVTELGVDVHTLNECRTADSSYRPWSLEASVDADGEFTLGDILAEGDQTDQLTDRLALRRVLATLSGRDRAILGWRFVDGLTQEEIGQRVGISQMQISRIIRRILGEAREALTEPEPLAG